MPDTTGTELRGSDRLRTRRQRFQGGRDVSRMRIIRSLAPRDFWRNKLHAISETQH